MSLVSRLDHLDFLMKFLERKQNLAKLESEEGSTSAGGELKKKQTMPVEVALNETHFKGSLMDRVTALETRLFQLCLEKEYSSTSAIASSSETNWSNTSKGESSCSLPTVASKYFLQDLHEKHVSKIHGNGSEIQEQEEIKNDPWKKKSSGSHKHTKKKTTVANKDGKKRTSFISWPHFKLLGC